jgi:dihydrofolate reductase
MKNERAIIVAYSVPGRVIGDRGAIPWMGQMPADMRRVREMTEGQAIIMGQRTFQSIGRPLPKRQNIVLSRDLSARGEIEVAPSLDAAFQLVSRDKTAFVFGGGMVYQEAMRRAEELDITAIYATEIHGDFSGDAFFPEIELKKWRETERQDFPADAKNVFPYSFVKYERKTR